MEDTFIDEFDFEDESITISIEDVIEQEYTFPELLDYDIFIYEKDII